MTSDQGKQSRTESAYRTVLFYQQQKGTDSSIEAAIILLLSDLRLLCEEYGVEVES